MIRGLRRIAGMEAYDTIVDDMREITTDSADFEHIRKHNLLYVDKTMYAYELIRSEARRFFFLSRPRRYGKSLFCSTLHAIFDGRRDLFTGLHIAEHTDYAFERYPVLHLNLATFPVSSFDWFLEGFCRKLRRFASEYGIDLEGEAPASMLEQILYGLDRQPAIIIDEFDAPFTSMLNGDASLLDGIRAVFNEFYSVLKNNGSRIRFLFLTGVTKLSSLSIFSAMNNLTDISMDPGFASAFGYTESELLSHFGEAIEEHYESSREAYDSQSDFIQRIRAYYDGYRFSPYSEAMVYNPVSIGFFFNSGCRFRNYWNMTGQSTMVIDLATRFHLADLLADEALVPLSAFESFDLMQFYSGSLSRNGVLALLYLSGYLTIKEAREELLLLGFPNAEIASTFTLSLAQRYAENVDVVETLPAKGRIAALEGDTGALIAVLSTFFEQCSSQILSHRFEQPYQLIMHMFFVAAGCQASVEEGTILGRIDNSMRVGKHIYLFELKVDRSPDEALEQIKSRRYWSKFAAQASDGSALHLVGIGFSSKERRVEGFREEILP